MINLRSAKVASGDLGQPITAPGKDHHKRVGNEPLVIGNQNMLLPTGHSIEPSIEDHAHPTDGH